MMPMVTSVTDYPTHIRITVSGVGFDDEPAILATQGVSRLHRPHINPWARKAAIRIEKPPARCSGDYADTVAKEVIDSIRAFRLLRWLDTEGGVLA